MENLKEDFLKINEETENHYLELYYKKKEIEKELELIKSSIIADLEKKPAIGSKISAVYVQPTQIFDSVKFKKDNPDVYSLYLKEKSGYYTIKVNEKMEG